jgi:hypothetical protein
VAHFLFNFSAGDRGAAVARLRAQTWAIGDDEPHRDEPAPGDLVLIYVAGADGGFIGRAEVRTVAGARPAGVLLCNVEHWDRAVPLEAVAARVDPTASNPVVQANVRAGFRSGVVRITAGEYEAALGACRDYQAR